MLRQLSLSHLRRWNLARIYLFLPLLIWVLYKFSGHQAVSTRPQPSVNVVLATCVDDDTSWTEKLVLSDMEIVIYVADNSSAPYHPPINKGNEAMIYLNYCYEFYDSLPDITIFTHGQDNAWHIDGALDYSTALAINSLDLHEVLHRQYFNLRISWENACPAWINTTVRFESSEFDPKLREEEPFVREAFYFFLPGHKLPEIFSAPCCSQFATTREAIRSLPRDTYKSAMDWIQNSHLPSSVTGRVFERLWQYMFLGKAIDCPNEFNALCRAYHICFKDEEDWEKWRNVEATIFELSAFRNALLSNGVQPTNKQVIGAGEEIAALEKVTRPWRKKAIERGRNEKRRMEIAGGEF